MIALAWESSRAGLEGGTGGGPSGEQDANAATAQALDLVAVQATGTDVTARLWPVMASASDIWALPVPGNLVLRPDGGAFTVADLIAFSSRSDPASWRCDLRWHTSRGRCPHRAVPAIW